MARKWPGPANVGHWITATKKERAGSAPSTGGAPNTAFGATAFSGRLTAFVPVRARQGAASLVGGARVGAAGTAGTGGTAGAGEAAAPLAPPAALPVVVALMVVVPTTAAGSDALEADGTDALADAVANAVAAAAGGEAEASTRRTGIPADSISTPVPSLPHPHTFSSFTEITTSPARTPIACAIEPTATASTTVLPRRPSASDSPNRE